MKKSILLLSLTVMCSSFLFGQGKTDKNGLRIKKWKVNYNVSQLKYIDPINFMPNWFESAKELEGDNNANVFEKVKYENGIKEGEFSWYLTEKRENMTKVEAQYSGKVRYMYSPKIMEGTYVNGKVEGKLTLYDIKTEKKICDVLYANGVPADQSFMLVNEYLKTNESYKELILKDGAANKILYWNSENAKSPMMELNYSNGLLEGVSKFSAASGEVYVEGFYKNGLLNGSLKTYYLNDGSYLSFTGPICETKINKNIYDIASENANTNIFKETIPKFRKDGPILTDGKFKFFEAQYADGKLIGKNHYYHSDGKKLYESTIVDCKETDWYWFDTNGKILDSDKKQSLPIVYSVEIKHTIHKCHYCTKQYELKTPIKIKETSNTEGKSSIIEAGWLYANQVDNTNAINSKCNSMQNRSTKHEFEEIKTWNTTENKTESASTYQKVLDAAKTFGQIEMSLFMNCGKVSAAALLNGKK